MKKIRQRYELCNEGAKRHELDNKRLREYRAGKIELKTQHKISSMNV